MNQINIKQSYTLSTHMSFRKNLEVVSMHTSKFRNLIYDGRVRQEERGV